MLLYESFQDVLIEQYVPKYGWNGQHAMLSNVTLLSIFGKNKGSSFYLGSGEEINYAG